MNLLPKSHQDFGHQDYWDTFFKKRGAKAFEWYGEYPELCGQLHKYIKPRDNTLVVGCGNSKLSLDLYDVGHHQITNIDISPVVIKQMVEQNRERTEMRFIEMDATAMTFADEEFSVVLDKGTLDALMTDDSADVKEIVQKYWNEIHRVLRVGGRYICVSLLQKHIIDGIVEHFPANHWMLRIVRCFEAEQKTASTSQDGTAMPVFIIIATKFKTLPSPVLEICMAGETMQRLTQPQDVIENVLSVQRSALICNGLAKSSIANMEEINIDLYQPDVDVPRYTCYILEQPPVRGNGKFAVFIVPQGRETDWLFCSKDGRRKLLASTHHDRVVIVTLHRDQKYETLELINEELADSVRSFASRDLPKDIKIPYLSLGNDVGHRETIFSGTSEMSGTFVVQEIARNSGEIFRQLIFLNNQYVIQSEALVKEIRNKKKEVIRKTIDHGYLACQHHLYMTLGVHLVGRIKKKDSPTNVMVVGLGGGSLCMFIHQCLRQSHTTAIEIDEHIKNVATNYFGLHQDNRLKIVIDDGLKFLCAPSKTKYDAILFDVDSKNTKLGMSCPPQSFLEPEIIDAVKRRIGTTGIFVLNLVCRDETLRDEVLKNLKTSFKSVCSFKLCEDVNEVVFCRDAEVSEAEWRESIDVVAKEVNELAIKNSLSKTDLVEWRESIDVVAKEVNELAIKNSLSKTDLVDVEDLMEELRL